MGARRRSAGGTRVSPSFAQAWHLRLRSGIQDLTLTGRRSMFGFGKKSKEKEREKLEKAWLALLEAARDLQRKGDIPAFAKKTAEAEQLRTRLDALESTPPDAT
jgi:hypothetical protein